jgi:hypothetical protein
VVEVTPVAAPDQPSARRRLHTGGKVMKFTLRIQVAHGEIWACVDDQDGQEMCANAFKNLTLEDLANLAGLVHEGNMTGILEFWRKH